jgi:hypothetical protein
MLDLRSLRLALTPIPLHSRSIARLAVLSLVFSVSGVHAGSAAARTVPANVEVGAFVGMPSGTVGFSRRAGKAALAHTVPHVVVRIADKQVRGINARRVVTMVANEKPARYWTNRQFVGNAMGEKTTSSPVVADLTVPLLAPSGGPNPTAFRLLNLRPKPLLDRRLSHTSNLTDLVATEVQNS